MSKTYSKLDIHKHTHTKYTHIARHYEIDYKSLDVPPDYVVGDKERKAVISFKCGKD